MHINIAVNRKEPKILERKGGISFIIELAESYKPRDGDRVYTNYTFFFSDGGKPGHADWYREAFQVGRVVSESCETLKISSREHNGTAYNSLQAADFPKLVFSLRGQSNQQRAPQQQQRIQSQPQPNPQSTFDDDNPF
ncbi:single-stranded DNA binding protein [Shigella phage vB_SflS-ISF001]|uniref:Single-stranded DNA binding protein n=1 Tax=Shigella phage vB_SflS-ISF001 TaxID=2048005 RepID=A0A2D1GQ17_9CAUD|nr:single-stranded DNA binding protein [Shigella phage vB_SflS-ISF001]ATN94094.1 single-stranded DNA binding protein [Shigella phage vB_SflS-ISF001]